MRILLAAVNAKYIHSNLAVYSLKAYVKDSCVEIAEYTINQTEDAILGDLYRRKPDVLCFSCYIWNIELIKSLAREFAKLCPETEIWLGGPEVSYDAEDVLRRFAQVKGVMKGEGEETFQELVRAYRDRSCEEESSFEEALAGIKGISFRSRGGEITENPWRPPIDLSKVPFVYENLENFRNRIIYYESSRGCPFSCSYCLSSIDKKLRFRDLSLVKRELQFLIDREVPQVKFVDRTFNLVHGHAMEIWRYIKEHDRGKTNFHFEIAADLLDEEEIALISGMRPGLIQLEIGVQSTNPETIREIRRKMDLEKVGTAVRRIRKAGNIHQHLDLIAGLPYEDLESFQRSFDEVYRLRPDQLQLGFLKVLKGSYMKEQEEAYGLVCKSRPPYEVLKTRWLSYEDILCLKGVEEMVEVYYNSRQFTHTVEAMENCFASAFSMYEGLWRYYQSRGIWDVQHKRSARYEIFLDFVKEKFPDKEEEIREWLIYDYYLRENAKTRPAFAGEPKMTKEIRRAFYEDEDRLRKYLPEYEKYDKNQMRRMTHLEYFEKEKQYVLFDYLERNPLNQEARTCIIENREGENL